MNKIIAISAGGTGGHLFPAEALAHELTARGYEIHLITDERTSNYSSEFPAKKIHVIPSATVSSKNPVKIIRALWKLWRGITAARRLFAKLRPLAVIGFGGYPTVPPLIAATGLGIPSLVHEQNAVMGRANKALSGRVDAIAGGFLDPDKSSHGDKIIVTGNPVRPAIIEAAKSVYQPWNEDEPFKLLVFGGSQGAVFFSDLMIEVMSLASDELKSKLSIVQQARQEDVERVTKCYRENGVSAEISPFFKNMGKHIGEAHLVVSRSGASTVTEISVIGRPAILVPYPYALDHDQAANAAALAAKGGAVLATQKELTTRHFVKLLEAYMSDLNLLNKMALQAKACGRPDAALLLADLVEAVAIKSSVASFKERIL